MAGEGSRRRRSPRAPSRRDTACGTACQPVSRAFGKGSFLDLDISGRRRWLNDRRGNGWSPTLSVPTEGEQVPLEVSSDLRTVPSYVSSRLPRRPGVGVLDGRCSPATGKLRSCHGTNDARTSHWTRTTRRSATGPLLTFDGNGHTPSSNVGGSEISCPAELEKPASELRVPAAAGRLCS